MLFATTRENPRSGRERRGIDRVVGAGDGARPERQRIGFGGNRTEACMVAAQRGGVREQEVRDEHGLRAPQVCIRRHQRRPAALGQIRQRADHRREPPLQHGGAAPEVQAEIERHLLVA